MTRWIVVGGGAAGSVVAATLSADHGNDVVLLEAGTDHGDAAPLDDRGPYLADPGRVMRYPFRRRSGGAFEEYLVGSGLGGSSLINGSIVVPDGPGGDGRHAIPLEAPQRIGQLGAAIQEADDRAEVLRLAARDGVRVTAADAYLRPALHRSNLTVHTDTVADSVVFDGRRATGVRTGDGGIVDGDRVVVAAGAIGTPLALMRSDVDTPGIGSNLQDHPALAISLRYTHPATDIGSNDITMAITTADHQIIALERTGADAAHGALIVGLIRTTSRGSIALRADGTPEISLDQLDTADDRERMVGAVLDAIELADRAPVKRLAADRFVDDRGTRLDALDRDPTSVAAWMLDHLTGFHHAAGTCRLGEVTDDHGWVRGYDGLAVADASLFVELPATNVYLSTILQAEQLAGHWMSNGG